MEIRYSFLADLSEILPSNEFHKKFLITTSCVRFALDTQ